MSYAAQAWVNDHAPYSGGAERAVLKELADTMNKDSEVAWPGIDRLSLDSGYSRRTVCRALKAMLQDGVVERANVGGGRGIKTGYRIVKDKTRWNLSRPTIAQMVKRREQARALEERKRKGDRMSQYRERKTVAQKQCNRGETVASATENSDMQSLTPGPHQLYEPDLTKGDEIVNTEGAEAEQRLNPRVGELVKRLVEDMDRKARAAF
jgi:hypothetical protein